ncbi:BCCIP protein [Acrasis kona]|uniref:BCCIP protein n=1 Tax=Acrasis kona TaxID=1008807 RepID=A0AAW2YW26_9EUKA
MSTRRITKPSNRNKIKPVIPKEVTKELTKKRTIKETESTSNADPKDSAPVDDEGDSEEEEYVDYVDDNQEDDVQVDFDVSIPDMEKDYYGLELYTKNFLVGQPYNYADLTQIVLGDEEKKEPNFLTSVIKVPYDDEKKPDAPKKKNKDNKSDEEELNWEWNDVYGFLSVVDMNKYKKSESVKQIKEYIMDKCKDKKMKDQLAEIFSGKVGLIVNERVMNLPFEVGAMLHENLHQEITEAVKEGECTFFKHYIEF